MGYLKERWSEAGVLALPEGEHNYFERKSGGLWVDKGELQKKLAKALSAFANSGGGHIILGQKDDGSVDGVPEREGRTPVREWLEQKVPNLVAHPLESFRVHVAVPDDATTIPTGRSLVVIDVGDSRLAPHQATFPSDAPQYYYRQGGKSVPAPHHYLEALRNRLTFAVLEPKLKAVWACAIYKIDSSQAVVDLVLRFEVTNVSRVTSYKWDVAAEVHPDPDDRAICRVVTRDMDARLGTERSLKGDTPLLPTRKSDFDVPIGLVVKHNLSLWVQLEAFLRSEVRYSAITEHHVGMELTTPVRIVGDKASLLRETKHLFVRERIDQAE